MYADDGKWHYFHDSSWTKIDADVACREIGFQEAVENINHPQEKKDSVVCKDYTCSGKESYLIKCPQGNVDYTGCVNKTIAGVVCKEQGI